MRKFSMALLTATLAVSGFAAAGAASGANPLDVLTGTTDTTTTIATTTTATTTAEPTTTGGAAARVALCHRTGSKKHPARTIVVAQSAVAAHLRHGDTLGPCEAAPAITTTTTQTTSSNVAATTTTSTAAEHRGGNPGRGHKK